MNIKEYIKPYLTRRNIIYGVVGVVLVTVAGLAVYIPGTYFKGDLNYQLSCNAVPNPATKGNTVVWTAYSDLLKTIPVEVIWYGNVGDYGSYVSEPINYDIYEEYLQLDKKQQNLPNTSKSTSTFTVTFADDYDLDIATVNIIDPTATIINSGTLVKASCTVNLEDPPPVSPPPLPQSLIISCDGPAGPVEVGENATFRLESSGGVSPVDYSWEKDGQAFGGPLAQIQTTFSTIGSHTMKATATDSSSPPVTESDTCSVTVVDTSAPPQTFGVECLGPATVEAGETVIFSPKTTGGTAPITYEWTGDAAILGSMSGVDLETYFNDPGAAKLMVAATDAELNVATDTCDVTVTAAGGQIPPAFPKVECLGPNVANVGENIMFEANLEYDPSVSVVHTWYIDGVVDANAVPVYWKIFNSAGDYVVKVIVNDNNGNTAENICNITISGASVTPPPGVVAVSCAPDYSSAYTGDIITWKAKIDSGPAQSNPKWSWSGGDQLTGSGASITKSYNSSGSKTAAVTLTLDDLSKVEADCSSVDVKTFSLACVASPKDPAVDELVTWSAILTGADAPTNVDYEWFGDAVGSTHPDQKSTLTAYDKEGKKTAKVEASYATGSKVSAECSIDVKKAATGLTDAEKKAAEEKAAADAKKIADAKKAAEDEKIADAKKAADEKDTTDTSKTSTGEASKCAGLDYPTDVTGDKYETYIKACYDDCRCEGYADGTFKSTSMISRAEAVKLAMNGILNTNNKCYDADCGMPYPDLEMWMGPYLRPAWDNGFIQGYKINGQEYFFPSRDITLSEAASLISRMYGIPAEYFLETDKPSTKGLVDYYGCYTANCGAGYKNEIINDIAEVWQGAYLRALTDYNVIELRDYTGANQIRPNRTITRGEMVKMVMRASGITERKLIK